jgi:2-oxoglutarate ferredoxin oxidoreductase subunit beta
MIRRFGPVTDFHLETHPSRDTERHGVHPDDVFLKRGRIPHIWCPGCGLGVVLNAFIQALKSLELSPDEAPVVSGIGCTGRSAGYLNTDSYHTTHGRAIPFATGLALTRPDLTVSVFSGDGDLFAIGGNHIIHAARRNVNVHVICVNNFNYGMTGGQAAPTTPLQARTSTTPYGNVEYPFNLVGLAASAGAVYVARWTAFHARFLVEAICESLTKTGFTFLEVLTPCPTGFNRPNKLGQGLDIMKLYREKSVIQHGADPQKAEEDIQNRIVVGKFIDIDRQTFGQEYENMAARKVQKR